jgi:hypothetical protein
MNINGVTPGTNLPVQAGQTRPHKARSAQTDEAQVRQVPVTTETTAFTVPIETVDAASAAIQNLAKNFLAQPKVALLAQATDFSENALRLLQ